MKVAVLQSNYLPWRGYFKIIYESDIFCFYDSVKYTKNDWRNRNIIVGPNGKFWITIPISNQSVNLKINQVQIIENKWRVKHLKSIEQSYSKSPYYKELKSIIEPIILDQDIRYLSNLNITLIKEICNYIGISTSFVSDTDLNYEKSDYKVPRLINIIKCLNGDHYISGKNGESYLDSQKFLFKKNNIKLSYVNHENYQKYNTQRAYFQNTSIVDLIANVKREEILNYL